VVYAETLVPQLYVNWAPLRAVVEERWKYIEAPRPELYDLSTDPGETRNVAGERGPTVRGLAQALEQVTGGGAGALAVGTLDRETVEKLASLGYVGAGAAAPATAAKTTRPDPKDMIGVYNQLRRANTAVREGRLAEALPVFRQVLTKDPRNTFALLLLGNAYKGANDNRRAIEQYRKYLELVPTNASVHTLLASCYLSLGDREGAVREADAAIAIDPQFSDARILKSGVLAARGDTAGALAELRAAVEVDPAKPQLRFEFAKMLGDAGQGAAAVTQFEAALELDADYVPALAGLGTLYARQGKHAEAARALERALAVAPQQDEARFNLAQVYEQLGRLTDARGEYQRLVGTPGTNPAVRAAAGRRLAALGEGGVSHKD
jgi:choline-sulfatase